jgi:hypothetical protein
MGGFNSSMTAGAGNLSLYQHGGMGNVAAHSGAGKVEALQYTKLGDNSFNIFGSDDFNAQARLAALTA